MTCRGRAATPPCRSRSATAGPYLAIVNGLWPPFGQRRRGQVPRGFVDDDPTNTLRGANRHGITGHPLTWPGGQLLPARRAVRRVHRRTRTNTICSYSIARSASTTSRRSPRAAASRGTKRSTCCSRIPGRTSPLVHSFETDPAAGGPGANYSLFTWSFGENDAAGNFERRGAGHGCAPAIAASLRMDLERSCARACGTWARSPTRRPTASTP